MVDRLTVCSSVGYRSRWAVGILGHGSCFRGLADTLAHTYGIVATIGVKPGFLDHGGFRNVQRSSCLCKWSCAGLLKQARNPAFFKALRHSLGSTSSVFQQQSSFSPRILNQGSAALASRWVALSMSKQDRTRVEGGSISLAFESGLQGGLFGEQYERETSRKLCPI